MPVFQPDIVESDHRPRLLLSVCRISAGGKGFGIALAQSGPALLHPAGNNAIASTIMHLTCPQCHTEYDVPDAALIGRSRTLRCGDCGAKFTVPALPEPVPAEPELPPHQEIAEDVVIQEAGVDEDIAVETDASFEPAEPVAAEPLPETVATETIPPLSATRTLPAPPPAAGKPSRALGVSVLVVLLLIGIALAAHRAIGHAWPPSLRLFNALGLH
jgi:predicted Zn finger-like uncharacterized protein